MPPLFRAPLPRLAVIEKMMLKLDAFLAKSSTPDVAFSEASLALVSRVLIKRHIRERPPHVLPRLEHLLPAASALVPFCWTRARTETAATADLLQLLQRWVTEGVEPPITNAFMDVQGLAARGPMQILVETVGCFKGMNDAVVLKQGLTSDEVCFPLRSCVIAVTWKHPSAFSLAEVISEATLQTIGFNQISGGDESVPVFFTDMATGFRCQRMVEGELGWYHGSSGDTCLTIAEGVALIRHYLLQDAEQLAARREMELVQRGAAALRAAAAEPDASQVPLEASSPEEEVAYMLSITYALAERLSTMGGFCMSDFCDRPE